MMAFFMSGTLQTKGWRGFPASPESGIVLSEGFCQFPRPNGSTTPMAAPRAWLNTPAFMWGRRPSGIGPGGNTRNGLSGEERGDV